jgi:hypothetical protein
VSPIDIINAKHLIIENHYLHKWTSCKYPFGVYYDNKLIGCIIYGSPVGRQVKTSITKTANNYTIMELTRLWIADGFGTNIESYVIGVTFKILKNKGIDIIISYSDPDAGHLGKIYQACNFIYQGNSTMLIKGYWHVINGVKMHPRTVVAKYGSILKDNLLTIDPNYSRIPMSKKHRYIYILNKKIKKDVMKNLKHTAKDYPK